MAMEANSGTKRQEPEPEVEAKEAAPSAMEKTSSEPEAKKQKTDSSQMSSVRKQVEYYLSDENLQLDKFFSEKISSNAEGWLETSLILSCKKMKALQATQEDIVAALKDSKLEVREDGAAVRRPSNAPLPKLMERQQPHKRNVLHAHDGGVVVVIRGVPAEQSWMQIKDALKQKLPEKVAPWFVSEVNEKAQCFVVCPPFQGDLALLAECTIHVGGAALRTEVCQGETLQQVLKTLPKHVRDKRDRESKRKQKERNRPILVGDQRFMSIGALRSKVKEIMNSRSNGERLKPEGTDFKLIKALLAYHPKGEEKIRGMVAIKVDKAPFAEGQSRCFHMIKDGDTSEDVSLIKCINAVELNPPYVSGAGGADSKAARKDAQKPLQQGEASKDAQKSSQEEAKQNETAAAVEVKEDKTAEA